MTSTRDRFMDQLAHLAERQGLEVVEDSDTLTIVRQGEWDPVLQVTYEFHGDNFHFSGLPKTIGQPSGVFKDAQSADFNELGAVLAWLDTRMTTAKKEGAG